jgi:hypothetical protein
MGGRNLVSWASGGHVHEVDATTRLAHDPPGQDGHRSDGAARCRDLELTDRIARVLSYSRALSGAHCGRSPRGDDLPAYGNPGPIRRCRWKTLPRPPRAGCGCRSDRMSVLSLTTWSSEVSQDSMWRRWPRSLTVVGSGSRLVTPKCLSRARHPPDRPTYLSGLKGGCTACCTRPAGAFLRSRWAITWAGIGEVTCVSRSSSGNAPPDRGTERGCRAGAGRGRVLLIADRQGAVAGAGATDAPEAGFGELVQVVLDSSSIRRPV